MISIKKIKTADIEYPFTEELLTTAFPPEEHRDLLQQREYTDCNSKFHSNVILENGIPIGLISYWDLDNFHYIEHFAVSPDFRNGGYGKRVLEYINEHIPYPIILEVELPENEMSKRRIGFYERIGYKLINEEYYQPPYRKQDSNLPMFLMIYDKSNQKIDIEHIKRELYKHVYNIE